MARQWFSLGTPVFFTNKTDRQDIAEILLKVVLNTLNLKNTTRTILPLNFKFPNIEMTNHRR
jgi:hypothetical protein